MHELHIFEVWLARRHPDDYNPEGPDNGYAPITPNASVVFTSERPAELHMPDNINLFFAQCRHEHDPEDDEGHEKGKDQRLPMVRGILHIGANVANEALAYSDCVGGNGANVLFVECDRQVHKTCAANARKYGQRCIHACLSDRNEEGVQFHVADDAENGGMSSSLRSFQEHERM